MLCGRMLYRKDAARRDNRLFEANYLSMPISNPEAAKIAVMSTMNWLRQSRACLGVASSTHRSPVRRHSFLVIGLA